MRERRWVLAGSVLAGLLLAACGGGAGTSGTAAASPASSRASRQAAMLKSGKTSLGTVLTNAQGRTLYWFAIDTSSASKCTGACASTWPPVTGTPELGAGVTAHGTLGTIKRSNGSAQATWKGHPLYTFSGDSAAGQANGNGVNSFGGLWHAVVLSGAAAGSSPSPSTGSSGGGYGGGY